MNYYRWRIGFGWQETNEFRSGDYGIRFECPALMDIAGRDGLRVLTKNHIHPLEVFRGKDSASPFADAEAQHRKLGWALPETTHIPHIRELRLYRWIEAAGWALFVGEFGPYDVGVEVPRGTIFETEGGRLFLAPHVRPNLLYLGAEAKSRLEDCKRTHARWGRQMPLFEKLEDCKRTHAGWGRQKATFESRTNLQRELCRTEDLLSAPLRTRTKPSIPELKPNEGCFLDVEGKVVVFARDVERLAENAALMKRLSAAEERAAKLADTASFLRLAIEGLNKDIASRDDRIAELQVQLRRAKRGGR